MTARDDYPIADPVGPGPSAYYDAMCAEIDRLRTENQECQEALETQAAIGADLARVAYQDEIDRLRDENEAAMTALKVVGTAYHDITAALDSIADKQVPTVLRQFRTTKATS